MANETLKATRGIEKGDFRVEAGISKSRQVLERAFGKKVVKHWISTGTLVKAIKSKGGANAGQG